MITLDYDEKSRKGKLSCEDSSIFGLIRNHFSVKKAGSYYIKKVNKHIPDRDYAIGSNGSFDFGLEDDIQKFIREKQLGEVEYTEAFRKRVYVQFGIVLSMSDTLRYDLREYQRETLECAFSSHHGTIVSATGSGKSLLQASLLQTYKEKVSDDFKCLLVVPGLSLVDQLMGDFEDYGVTFTYSGWTGGTNPQDTQVIIANSENLCSQFSNFKWLTEVDLVITDECHKVNTSSKLAKVLHKIKTPYKFGFTGTLPKALMDKWKVIGTFGRVIYEKKSKELRDEGYLSNAIIKIIKLNHSLKIKGYEEELQFIHESSLRNNMIKVLVKRLDKNVLILVNRLEHGNNLLAALELEGKEVYFINGEMPVEERQSITNKMEIQDNIVCIAMSKIFSTGINIKNLHYIMFVSGGKSFIRTIQSIGRGLRLHDSKDQLVLFDIYDNLKYSKRHVEERKQFYTEEQIPWKESEINLLGKLILK